MPLPPDPHDDDTAQPGEVDAAAAEPGGPVEVTAGAPREPAVGTGVDLGPIEVTASAPREPAVGTGVDLGPIDTPPPAPPPSRPRPPRSPAYNTPKSAAYSTQPPAGVLTPAAPAAATTPPAIGAPAPAELAAVEGTAPSTVLGPRRDRNRLRWTLVAVVAIVVGSGVVVALTGGDPGTDTAAPATTTTEPGGAPQTTAPPGGEDRTGTGDDVVSGAPAGSPGDPATPTTTDPHDPTNPVGAMQAYLDAIKAKDCTTMVGMVTVSSLPPGPNPRAAAVAACEQGFARGETGLSASSFSPVRLVSVSKTRAVVSFRQMVGGDTSTQTVLLLHRNGRWLVSLSP